MNTSPKTRTTRETKLTSKGYLIREGDLTKEEKIMIKSILNPTPRLNEDFQEEIKPIKCYKIIKGHYVLPRFFGIKHFGEPLKVFGLKGLDTNFKFNTTLRDYQKPIVKDSLKAIRKQGGGILKLPCGAGKTVLGIYMASKLKRKTLIVVHKTFLQDQWKERIEQFTNAKIGILRQDKIEVEGKDIVIGLLQSIIRRKYGKEIMSQFGTVIYDECHHLGSRKFSEALSLTGSKYVIGLSATPTRADGLTKIINWHINKIIYTMKRKSDKRVQVRMINYATKDIKFKEAKRWIKGKVRPNPIKMIGNMTEIKSRSNAIIKILKQILKEKERKVIVLSWRLSHLDELRKMIDMEIKKMIDEEIIVEGEISTSHYVGGMKADALEEASEADIIFSTYAMAEEGLDIPDLNTVFFVTPKKNVIQSVGRILRKQLKVGDISPLVLDFADELSVFTNWRKYRGEYYNKNNYSIEDVYFYKNELVNEYTFIKEHEKLSNKKMQEMYPDIKNEAVTMEKSFDIQEIFELAEDPFSDKSNSEQEQKLSKDEVFEEGIEGFMFG